MWNSIETKLNTRTEFTDNNDNVEEAETTNFDPKPYKILITIFSSHSKLIYAIIYLEIKRLLVIQKQSHQVEEEEDLKPKSMESER
ncbi:uncharacterized protein G2W53_003032 [Senna tora]|uniref:Uncharacterized protein n=1 Tax=Senna tora TaxID=362788 RepID=A0A835CFX9_9FABA|nr:uncharacterized protein G2W53_003032 [Senna tora]